MRTTIAAGAALLALASALTIATTSSADPIVPAAAAGGSIDLCAQTGYAAGFQGNSLVTAIAVAMAESSCNPSATNWNSNGSEDRGLWQINNAAHPSVSDACAFDPQCNANAAFAISAQGNNWTPWSTYNNGAYEQFLGQAQAAADRVSVPSIGPGNKANSGIDDVSGDGHADLLWSDGASVNYLPNNSGSQGGVPFQGTSSPVVRGLPGGALVAAGSITGHNTADLFVYDPGSDSVRLYPGAGGSTPYSGTGWVVATQLGGNVKKIFAADLTGDGYADLVYTKTDGTAWFLPNNSASTANRLPFTGEQATQIVQGLPSDAVVAMGDLNHDGYADLLYTSGGNLYALMNNIIASNGNPYPEGSQRINDVDGSFGAVQQMTAADLSGDGVADLLWVDANGEVNYLPNNFGSNPNHEFFAGPSQPVASLGTGHTFI